MKKNRTISSKWKKTKALLKHSNLQAYIPNTKIMNARTLEHMLNVYKMVYVKPDVGSFGMGVMKIQKIADGSRTIYRYQAGKTVKTFYTYSAMYRSLVNQKAKKNYLVQQGIRLLKYRGRRFDIRVMVQKNPNNSWEATGIIGRLSHPRKIVTNYHNGGTPMSVRTLLKPYKTGVQMAAFENHLKKVSVRAAAALQKAYPGLNSIGADIGVDRSYTPWILELNTRPDPYIFNQLKDKSMYRKVYRYAKRLRRI